MSVHARTCAPSVIADFSSCVAQFMGLEVKSGIYIIAGQIMYLDNT